MISRGFAANVITNIVLKFGDNRAKVRGVTGGGKFLEKLQSPITQKLMACIVPKRLKRIKTIFFGVHGNGQC